MSSCSIDPSRTQNQQESSVKSFSGMSFFTGSSDRDFTFECFDGLDGATAFAPIMSGVGGGKKDGGEKM